MRCAARIPENVDDYINEQPADIATTLKKLRKIIRAAAPKATETISYQVPVFKHIYMLVGLGLNKNYCSLYVMSPTLVRSLKTELQGVKVSGSTLHFSPGQPLPEALIRKIVKARVMENEERAASKKSAK